jgi:death-on-curing protein
MSRRIRFLSVDQVLEIHRRGIADHGGGDGLRDRGLLESAVAMPMASFGGKFLHEGLAAMAAACHFHLCGSHPFVDGNRPVAVAAAETFIQANGGRLQATDAELERLTVGVADGSISKEQATKFFKAHVTE